MALSRRSLLAGSVAALGSGVVRAAGAVLPAGRQVAGLYRYRLGGFELTAINDGVWHLPIDQEFVRNASWADVQQAMRAAYLPAVDNLPLSFTALLVNTGTRLVLIDTGTGGQIAPTAGLLEANLAAAGASPRAIDTIIISHFHPDHIDGLKTKDDELVFPGAEILVPEAEWDFWMDDANLRSAPEVVRSYFLNARRVFRNIPGNLSRYRAGQEIVPGITAVAAPGHTPGHQALAIASGNDAMLLLSDTSTHPALFVRHPEWQAAFDLDGALAVQTRRRLLDQVSADRMLVAGYHFPFPACGHIARTAGGYELYPTQWQPQL